MQEPVHSGISFTLSLPAVHSEHYVYLDVPGDKTGDFNYFSFIQAYSEHADFHKICYYH